MSKKNSKKDKAEETASGIKKEKIKLGTRDLVETSLPFERPVLELEKKIKELRAAGGGEGIDFSGEIQSVSKKLEKALKEIYENLTPWQRVQVSRHPLRPYTMDYIKYLTQDFVELHGDRRFSDDKAIVCGFAKWDGEPVCVLGHQKGRDTKENLLRSFGSAHPDGYRKAMRIMRLAERFGRPIIAFVDTPGAYPGVGAEERGQAEAIAYNLREMAELTVPVIVIVIGEGGSGGALGIAVGDHICVLENAYYSVISPEGCAAILWKENSRSPDAANALKLTGQDLLKLGVIDEVIPEPLGGAHRDFEGAAENVRKSVNKALAGLKQIARKDLPSLRYQKFRKMGFFVKK